MTTRIAALLALTVLAAACGGDDDAAGETTSVATDDVPSGAPAADGSADGDRSTSSAGTSEPPVDTGRPVTIEHRFGTTTIEAVPERIVTLDTQWTDVMTALGAPLVGVALDPTVEGDRYPWQTDIPAGVVELPVTDTFPFEAIAAARPDLIAVSFFLVEQDDYDRLSQIAPVIPLLGDEEVDSWQDMATTAGEVLGRQDEAAALVTDAEQASADLLAELPGLEGATYALANYVPGDAIYVVADPDDGAGILFGQLGMEIDPELLALADGAAGRVQLSLERIDELDADVVIMLTNGADTADIPGYESLPAVRTGAVAILDLPTVVGINTPTPLSVPYALDAVRPALEAAAAARS